MMNNDSMLQELLEMRLRFVRDTNAIARPDNDAAARILAEYTRALVGMMERLLRTGGATAFRPFYDGLLPTEKDMLAPTIARYLRADLH